MALRRGNSLDLQRAMQKEGWRLTGHCVLAGDVEVGADAD